LNRHVNSISGRLSLRPPQRRSLEILDRVAEIAPPRKGTDLQAALAAIRSEFPTVTDFERDFPSLCFALATGVGKTRLMGAFIGYLHLAHGVNNFFVLAPNLTIYNKLIADFTPNTPKYVFTGIAEFAVNPPAIITGDNYDQRDPTTGVLFGGVRVNIFNISKINTEVRGGRSPRIKRLSEYIGQSYFDYLAGLDDLVLLMDESHRYRASAGVRAINELKPVIGLELTATPQVETGREPVRFKNVIYDYPLARAMQDGFVKEPAVVTQKNFDPKQFTAEQLEQIKLEDGVRLHESTKVEIETWALQNDRPAVKPFILVIARDTTHAGSLLKLIQSEKFFEGRYKDKVIQVDSSRTGVEADEIVERLLKVEHADEPTEIVIHVNMLKEGWDVTNLYTIVPLRAANARTLIEQSIGRGLRLPYGRRTGASAVDRLNIVAHDRFQEIVDEANRSDSVVRLQQVILDPQRDLQKTVTVVAQSPLDRMLEGETVPAAPGAPTLFATEAERAIADATRKVIERYEHLPSATRLLAEDVQKQIVQQVAEIVAPAQLELAGVAQRPDLAALVEKTTTLMVGETIDIPKIVVQPKSEVTVGYRPFKLDVSAIRYQPVDRDLLIQHLRTREQETLSFAAGGQHELRLEDYVVRGLIDFDDISYDDHADLLYELAGQLLSHLRSYLSEDDARNVLLYHQQQIAAFVHAQMQAHQWERAVDYDVSVPKGFTRIKASAFTARDGEPLCDFRQDVEDKGHIQQMLFGGFKRCLIEPVKFQSDTERRLSVILDRETQKWFRPAKGQFQIFYKSGVEHLEYLPDFVAETGECIYMLECKARKELEGAEVLAKKAAAEKWCGLATAYTTANGGKPWRYVLIPHDAIAENMTLIGLSKQFGENQAA
jgi:type III restriction enzyme